MITPQDIEKAVQLLREGGVVVFPTETAYGLAADARNEDAVAKVFEIKGREATKSFPLIAADVEMVERVAGIPRGLRRLADKHWPGALTLVLPETSDDLAAAVIRNGEIAIRVSSHPIAQSLTKGLGAPIVSTSANIAGEPVCYTIDAVRTQLGDIPDMYLDAGELSGDAPSTVVSVDDYGYPDVLRQGAIEIEI
ncbi:threonylcarbamoyl-AMP synthase [Candidatus Uhrbacteria bacterium]|jgi:L-threonylcarbamoyladenylate synthase|nr:threonylcarbamoyl-AMP synthase [Candidatus Uhrbacteria bacterium]